MLVKKWDRIKREFLDRSKYEVLCKFRFEFYCYFYVVQPKNDRLKNYIIPEYPEFVFSKDKLVKYIMSEPKLRGRHYTYLC